MSVEVRNCLTRIKKLKKENNKLREYVFEKFLNTEGGLLLEDILHLDYNSAMSRFRGQDVQKEYQRVYLLLGKEYISKQITCLIKEQLTNIKKNFVANMTQVIAQTTYEEERENRKGDSN